MNTPTTKWTATCESGVWFPCLPDYSPIPATYETAVLQAAAPELLAALEAVLEATIYADMEYGIALTEAEIYARDIARSAIHNATNQP